MTKYYEAYKRWMEKHPRQHRLRVIHGQRTRSGWYKTLPRRIKNLKRKLKESLELRKLEGKISSSNKLYRLLRQRRVEKMYTSLRGRIRRYEEILRRYSLGKFPYD